MTAYPPGIAASERAASVKDGSKHPRPWKSRSATRQLKASKHDVIGRLQIAAQGDQLARWCKEQIRSGDTLHYLLFEFGLTCGLSDADSVFRATAVRSEIVRGLDEARNVKWRGRSVIPEAPKIHDARPLVRLERGYGPGDFSRVEQLAIRLLEGAGRPSAANPDEVNEAEQLAERVRSHWMPARRGRGRPKEAGARPRTYDGADVTLRDILDVVVPIIERECGTGALNTGTLANRAVYAAIALAAPRTKPSSAEREIRSFVAGRVAAGSHAETEKSHIEIHNFIEDLLAARSRIVASLLRRAAG